jgi:hypothetical protein
MRRSASRAWRVEMMSVLGGDGGGRVGVQARCDTRSDQKAF